MLPYLPKSQLLAQWRELNSIFKKQDKHILINYVYEYPKFYLYYYSSLVVSELINRGYRINKLENYRNYFSEITDADRLRATLKYKPFERHHTNQYLLQCFMNLEEKYFCGQKDFDRETYLNLWEFVNKELNGLLEEISQYLKEE